MKRLEAARLRLLGEQSCRGRSLCCPSLLLRLHAPETVGAAPPHSHRGLGLHCTAAPRRHRRRRPAPPCVAARAAVAPMLGRLDSGEDGLSLDCLECSICLGTLQDPCTLPCG